MLTVNPYAYQRHITGLHQRFPERPPIKPDEKQAAFQALSWREQYDRVRAALADQKEE